VLFNLSAIVGSGILYGDFKKAKFHQFVTFLYGCGATFAGVFIIAWDGRNHADDGPDTNGNPPPEDGTSAQSGMNGGDDERFVGSFSRRKGMQVLPRDTPSLRHRQSSVGLIGLSPAQVRCFEHNSIRTLITIQHLLLIHTPPREFSELRDRAKDPPRETTASPESF
jgi:magnesium transporter